MADYNSSLPIRTESNGDAAIKIVDGAIPSQELTVNADGSLNITDNGASITVDGTVTVTATDLDIRDLAFATDSVDVSGSSVDVTATDLDIRDLSSAQDSVEVLQATHDNLNANANIQVGDADVANGNPVPVSDAGGSLTVDAIDLDIRDLTHVSDSVKIGDGTDFLAVNADGSINVNIAASATTPINDYNTATAVAAAATSNHTYTSVGNFYLTQIEASASGKLKIEVQINSVTKFVQFNSIANPNCRITLTQPILATTGQTVVIIRTNADNQAQNLYSTISGYNA